MLRRSGATENQPLARVRGLFGSMQKRSQNPASGCKTLANQYLKDRRAYIAVSGEPPNLLPVASVARFCGEGGRRRTTALAARTWDF